MYHRYKLLDLIFGISPKEEVIFVDLLKLEYIEVGTGHRPNLCIGEE
jgi:hypothetical protein